MKVIIHGIFLLSALIPVLAGASDSCDIRSPRMTESQTQIVASVKTAVISALDSRSIPVNPAQVNVQSTVRCYLDPVDGRTSGQVVYNILIEASVTTARGNVLVLDPLVYEATGERIFDRYDNEGVPVGKGYAYDFELEINYDGSPMPQLKNPTSGVVVVNVSQIKQSLHVED